MATNRKAKARGMGYEWQRVLSGTGVEINVHGHALVRAAHRELHTTAQYTGD